MNNGKTNFFDNDVVYSLNCLKSWEPVNNEKVDSGHFPCIPCMGRQNLFKFLKTDYNIILKHWTKILGENNCEATDIDIGNGMEKMEVNLFDDLYPLDKFYFSVNFTGKYHGEIKTALYVDNEDKGSLVISNSINAVLKFNSIDECRPALSNLRKIFWQASKMTSIAFATNILGKNKLLKEEHGDYLIECLTASSSKLNGDLIEKLSKNEPGGGVDKEIRGNFRDGWLMLDGLIVRNRRFKKGHFVLEKSFSRKVDVVTLFVFKNNSKCAVFMGMSNNPSEFNKSLGFKLINISLKLN